MPIKAMRVDGGAVVNDFLMQFQADILGIPLDVPMINETTALGAAYLAAMGISDFNSLSDISGIWKLKRRFEPRMSEDERQNRIRHWKRAVERAKSWVEK